jgi:hypothetical protein
LRDRAAPLVAAWLAAAGVACAQPADPNLAHPNYVINVARDGYTIAGLVTHLKDATRVKHGVALFPGHPGIMRVREEDGRPRFELGGNFLVRSRRHWLDDDAVVVVVDAPSDQWATFYQQWRASPRYGADVAALIDAVAKRHAVEDWTFVGTSEGVVSAFHAARMNPRLARRVILTSSVWGPTANGPGISDAKWHELSARLLWVHHESDPCRFTAYREARGYAEKSQSPLVTVRGGGPGRGDPCGAFTAHGFVGVERETVLAMRSWTKTGVVPPDVAK